MAAGDSPFRSPTLELAERVAAARSAGRSVLGVSTPAFPDRTVAAPRAELPTAMAMPRGDEGLRTALAGRLFHRWSAGADDLLVVPGAKAGVLLAIAATVRPGGTVVLPTPCWPTYQAVATALGHVPRRVALDAASGWALEAPRLLAGLHAGDAVVMSNPCNPTGRVYGGAEIDALATECAGRGVTLLLDESFSETVDVDVPADWGVTRERGNVLVLNSVSKNFLAQGWRIGAVLATPAVLERLESTQTALLSAPAAPLQTLLRELLERDAFGVSPTLGEVRAATEARLARAGCEMAPSRGTFYCYPRIPGLGAVRDALEREDALYLLTGDAFLHPEAEFMRLSLLQPPGDLERILERIERRLAMRRSGGMAATTARGLP